MPINFWLDRLFALVLLLIVLKFKISVAFRNFAERQSSHFIFQAVLFLLPSLLLWTLLGLLFHITTDSLLFPRSISSEIESSHQYARQLGSFIELMSGWLACYITIRLRARGAWLWFWLLYEATWLTYAISLAAIPLHLPAIYSPLTVKRPALAKMVQTAELRHGLKDLPISIAVDSSETGSSAESFGVAGYFAVTLSPGMLKSLDDSQLLSVVGHEIGHIADADGLRVFMLRACAAWVWISFAYALASQMITWYGPRLGIRSIQDFAGLPILAMCFIVFTSDATLGLNWYHQHLELRADCFAVKFITGEVDNPVDVAQSALTKLQPRDDNSWRSFRLGPASHPSLAIRILSMETCQDPRHQ